ncbi:ATP-binding protein [Rhodococcoides kyotonense]|uniref:AAA ATPase domain-containing protein n=1 Tax=Rhodococcoides kyotonense TaxID=398843 RepID=A0A239KGG9_9NOCA|nr:ATP-binding protein [Rhodococcus kyotonensis]SNT17437.1 AAA ATPase domain-containing protein [Rhodococcus kyotonensis]
MENPYTPDFGAVPGRLVGREGFATAFTSLLDGLDRGHPRQSQIITGLRGMGKTALLREFAKSARVRRWAVVDTAAARRDDLGFRRQFTFEFRSALLSLSPRTRWGDKTKAAAGVLGSFASTLGVDSPLTDRWDFPTPSSADTGDLSADVTATLLALGEAAQESGTGVVFVVDEIHRLTVGQLAALVDGLHRTYLRELPITLVGAGIPRSDALPPETQVRANRLFDFADLGPLSESDVAALLRTGQEWDDDAIASAFDRTRGVPAFVHALGHVLWEKSRGATVTPQDLASASVAFEDKVDKSFFGSMLSRATELELSYLRAVVDATEETETARLLERTAHQCAHTRTDLVEKGLLYLRPGGTAAFTAPAAAEYLLRVMPTVTAPARKPRRRRYDP